MTATRVGVLCCLFGCAVGFVSAAHGQAPAISTISPLGLRPGQSQVVTLGGTNLGGASQFWTSCSSHSSLASTPKPSAGSASFRVTVPLETPPGIYAARVATDKGISPLRLLVVDDLPTVTRQPSNSAPTRAQRVKTPVAVDATLEPLQRHYYRIQAEAGQRLSVEVLARRLGSALDPTLRLFGPNGREIDSSDDVPGLSEDAAIDHVFKTAGDYVIEVGDNLYQGGGNYFYRLRIGDFPAALVPFPLGGKRGSEVTFRFADQSGREVEPVPLRLPTNPLVDAIMLSTKHISGSASGFATIELSDQKDSAEIEPNNDAKSANRIEIPSAINGRLQPAGDRDQFVFRGKAGQKIRWQARARQLGSPADLVLRVFKVGGADLAKAESNGSDEAVLTSTLPADGEYRLEVHDLNHRGGPRYVYRVDASIADPSFELVAAADTLNVPQGGTAIVRIHAIREGYAGPIQVRATDLPPGVTSVPTVIGAGQDGVELSLQSKENAATGRVHPVRIFGEAKINGRDFSTTATVLDELEPQFSAMPYPPVSLAFATAVGIAPRPNFTLRTEPRQIVFGRNLSAKIRVIADRQKGFDEEIALAVIPPVEPPPSKNKKVKPASPLPPGITAALKPIPKGSSSVEIVFHADRQAQLSDYTSVLQGTLKKGNTAITEPAPGIGLRLDVPFRLSVQPVAGKLVRKGTLNLNVRVQRNPAFSGAIDLSLRGAPKGVTAKTVQLKSGSESAELVLAATTDAAPGNLKFTIRGRAKVNDGGYTTEIPAPPVVVE